MRHLLDQAADKLIEERPCPDDIPEDLYRAAMRQTGRARMMAFHIAWRDLKAATKDMLRAFRGKAPT